MEGRDAAAGRIPWGRLIVTLLVTVVLVRPPHIVIPGIDAGEVERFSPGGNASLEVFALGIMPYLSASLLVELVALVVPRWQPLRHGGPAGRKKLARATALATLALCLFQSYAIAKLIDSMNALHALGSPSLPVVIVTLTAGTCFLGLLAELATAYGLVGGFVLAYVARALVGIVRMEAGRDARDLVALGTFTAFVVAATWFMLRRDRSSSSEPPAAYRVSARGPAHSIVIPALASGIVPLALGPTMLDLVRSTPRWAGLRIRPELLQGQLVATLVPVGCLLAFGALLGWLCNEPARVARLVARARGEADPSPELEAEARAAVRTSTLRGLAFLAVVSAVEIACRRIAPTATSILFGAMAAVVTALVLDALAEVRARRALADLVPVWPEHRPYAMAPVREALGAANIPVFARGENLRGLLQYAGPYAPIDLFVPREHETQARSILERVLAPAPEDTQPRAPVDDAPQKIPFSKADVRAMVAVVAAAVFCVVAVPSTTTHRSEPLHVRKDLVQIVPVDDDLEAFGSKDTSLPGGVRLQVENAPTGPGRSTPRTYAMMVRQPSETIEATYARMRAWTSTRKLPNGRRIGLGDAMEYDPDLRRQEVAGVRTFVLAPEVVVDGADIVDAAAHAVDGAAVGPGVASVTVSVALGKGGAARFEDFTSKHLKRRLAIVVEGKVVSAPVILTPIPGGHIQITMGAGDPEQQLAEAKRLEQKLRGR